MESSRANLPSVDTDVEPARFKCRVKVDHAVSISCACLLDQFCWTGFEEYMNFFSSYVEVLDGAYTRCLDGAGPCETMGRYLDRLI